MAGVPRAPFGDRVLKEEIDSLLQRTERLEAQIARLGEEKERLESERVKIGALNTDLRFAILKVNAAAAGLSEAAQQESEAFKLQNQASEHHRLAAAALRKAERAREAAMAPLLIESFPNEPGSSH